MAEITRESALESRRLAENYEAYMQSPFGEALTAKLDEIDKNASDKALRGATPESTNVFFESRGRVAAVTQLKQLFADIEKEGSDARIWLQANPPQESA